MKKSRKSQTFVVITLVILFSIMSFAYVYADTQDTTTAVSWSTTDKTSTATLSNNNLTVTFAKGVGHCIRTDKSVKSGKYYWEVKHNSASATAIIIGVAEKDIAIGSVHAGNNYRALYALSGQKCPNAASYAVALKQNDIVGVLLDMDNKTISYRINNTDYGVAFADLPGANISPFLLYGSSYGSSSVTANFGATSFNYPLPEGYLPFDSSNYPTAPMNLYAEINGTQVTLKWDAVEGATKYNVKRSTESGVNYATVANVVYAPYTETLTDYDTTYYYVVSAVDEVGEGPISNEVAVTIPNKPILDITAEKNVVKINDEFTVDVLLSNVTNICAEDIRINYNTELFQYLGAEPTQGLMIYNESQPETGTLRFIVASLGKDNAVTGERALIKLKFTAKKAGQDKIDIIRGRIADNGTMEIDVEEANCGDELITVEGMKDVNRSGEFTLIDLAIDAWYYNEPVANTDTTKYDTDLSGDGTIDDVDLTTIVQEMLKNSNYTPNL